MAVLTIVKNQYDTEEVHENLIHYAMYPKVYNNAGKNTGLNTQAEYYGGYNLFLGTSKTAVEYAGEQMLYALQMAGKDYGQCLKHFILSFDSEGEEGELGPEDAYRIAGTICRKYLSPYQTFYSIHQNRSTHLHIHFIVNGINIQTGYKFPDKKATYQSLKRNIGKMPELAGCKLTFGGRNQ